MIKLVWDKKEYFLDQGHNVPLNFKCWVKCMKSGSNGKKTNPSFITVREKLLVTDYEVNMCYLILIHGRERKQSRGLYCLFSSGKLEPVINFSMLQSMYSHALSQLQPLLSHLAGSSIWVYRVDWLCPTKNDEKNGVALPFKAELCDVLHQCNYEMG